MGDVEEVAGLKVGILAGLKVGIPNDGKNLLPNGCEVFVN